ncbi:Glycosyltransferase involved in cell wall bisynthesis [Agrococcus baldri]|uniref:Glycosyltransferase involved in cell wall bisynthesis n=1 Tax=Agrococcus baldri TaxID=153730 RepID=A0AA94KYN0_9MICO|nr:Glycosyltransferase involved in cell wall bisynthesis [Agrococcus baldri]
MSTLQGIRVTHVSSAHPWTDNRIHFRESASLADAGADVSLVAVESSIGGVTPSVRTLALPKLPRLKRASIGALRAVIAALRTRAPILHLHDPELVFALPLLRAFGKTVIYDAHEDLPEQVGAKAYLSPFLRRPAQWLAHGIVGLARHADLVVAATETIAKRFPADRTVIVHNYPPLRAEEADAPVASNRPRHVVYIGGIASSRGASVMVKAASEPDFPAGWSLELAGTAGDALIAALRTRAGWKRVNFHGQVPPDDARDILLSARVGLLLFQDSKPHRDALPTKMFEYFAAGVPVIASDFPLWRTIIDRWQCGTLVDQTDEAAVARAIRRYAENPQLLDEHSRNARTAAEQELNWSTEATALTDAYARFVPRLAE